MGKWLFWSGLVFVSTGVFAIPGAQVLWHLTSTTQSSVCASAGVLLGVIGGSLLVNAWIVRRG
jgi:hypothetical protein